MKKILPLRRLLVGIVIAFCVGCALTSCKAWRTISTTSTYTQQNDSTNNKITTTISSKTTEEYTGVKKN